MHKISIASNLSNVVVGVSITKLISVEIGYISCQTYSIITPWFCNSVAGPIISSGVIPGKRTNAKTKSFFSVVIFASFILWPI